MRGVEVLHHAHGTAAQEVAAGNGTGSRTLHLKKTQHTAVRGDGGSLGRNVRNGPGRRMGCAFGEVLGAGAENLQAFRNGAAVAAVLEECVAGGPGIEGANMAGEVRRRFVNPVELRLLLGELVRKRDFLRLLRARHDEAGPPLWQAADNERGAEFRKAFMKGAGRVVGVDRLGLLHEDVAAVHAGIHAHDGDAGNGVARVNAAVDRGRTAIAREKREVDVDAAKGRKREDLRPEELAVGHDDDDVGPPVCDLRPDVGGIHLFGRNDRQSKGEGGVFRLAGLKTEFAPAWAVRLGDDALNDESRRPVERAEDRAGDIGRTHEDDAERRRRTGRIMGRRVGERRRTGRTALDDERRTEKRVEARAGKLLDTGEDAFAVGVDGDDAREAFDGELPHGLGRAKFVVEPDVLDALHALGEPSGRPADHLDVDASVLAAGGLDFRSHAALAEDDPYAVLGDDLRHVRVFAAGRRGTGGDDAPACGLRGIAGNDGAAMEDGAVMEVGGGLPTFGEILVEAVASGVDRPGNGDGGTERELADVLFAEGGAELEGGRGANGCVDEAGAASHGTPRFPLSKAL